MKIETFVEIYWKNNKKIHRIYKTFSPFSNQDFIHWIETDLQIQAIDNNQEVFINIIFDLESKYCYTDKWPTDWHCKPFTCKRISWIKTLGPTIENIEQALSSFVYT